MSVGGFATSFETGSSVVSVADLSAYTFTVSIDGEVARLKAAGEGDAAFLDAKLVTARYYVERVLPEAVDTHSLLDGQRIPLGIGGPNLEPVYASGHVLAIGAGSVFLSHVNDAGFWADHGTELTERFNAWLAS